MWKSQISQACIRSTIPTVRENVSLMKNFVQFHHAICWIIVID
jgi:hypothetical protein